MSISPDDKALIDDARSARAKAYAPYSGFSVGAALLLRDGRTFSGTNVENSSYGLTVCAERNAIGAAVLGGAKPGDVVCVAVAVDAPSAAQPCGACRQVLHEFCGDAARILAYNERDGKTEETTSGALLPSAFGSSQLGGAP